MQLTAESVLSPTPGIRIEALDIFRGLTMAGMILVNDPGIATSVYAPLEHAAWNGITPTDFVFPSFIFIVGISVVLSLSGQLKKGTPKKTILIKVCRRAITLYLIGLFLSILPTFNLNLLRYTGVLHRISVVYFCCSMLFLFTSRKFQIGLAIFILVAYFLVMTLVPVPGYGYAILEPGKNMAAWVDSFLLPGKMYQGTWDPEGVLSSFTAVVTGIAGMLTGHFLLGTQTAERKIIWLFFAGFISFAIANGWHWFFPINKNLWTSSFVMYMAGLDCLILASLYFLVDLQGVKKWATFAKVFGSNAITAYLVSEFFYNIIYFKVGGDEGNSLNDIIIRAVLPSGLSPEMISFIWALSYVLLCFIPVYVLYKKKIFLKI